MPPPPPPQPQPTTTATTSANGGKVTPNLTMDAEGTRLLNLTVLQRLDPAVEDILITAAHVTLYDFNIDLNQWVSDPPLHSSRIRSGWLLAW
jgi:mRNA-decapping enzyme 1B